MLHCKRDFARSASKLSYGYFKFDEEGEYAGESEEGTKEEAEEEGEESVAGAAITLVELVFSRSDRSK